MGLVNIFTNKFKGSNIGRATADGRQVFIPVDVIESEGFHIPAEITKHPVENGAPVSDHIIILPKTLTIEGKISESPLDLSSALQGASTAVGGALSKIALGTKGTVIGGVAGGIAGKSLSGMLGLSGNTGTRVKDAVEELIAARDSRAPVIIQTGLRTYPSKNDSSFYIQDVTVTRNKQTGEAISVKIEFQEVITATSLVIQIAYPTTTSGTKKVNAGSKDVNALTANQNKSFLAKGVDGLGSFVSGFLKK